MEYMIDEEFRQRNRKQTKAERLALEELIDRDGCADGALVCGQLEGQKEIWLIDGHNTVEICAEQGKPMTEPRLLLFKDRQAILEWIDKKQEGRRNLSTEELEERRQKRIDRVAEGKAQGKSNRTMAEEENVGESTIRRDAEAAKLCDRCRRVGKVDNCQACQELASGAPRGAPGPKKPPKVTGKDGKTYRASKPKKPKTPKAPKPPDSTMQCPTCKGEGRIPKAARNAVFDAIAKITCSDPKTAGPHISKVVKVLMSADPPYTAEDVMKLPAAIKASGMDFTITIGSIEKHIGRVRFERNQAAPKLSAKDAAEYNRREREKAGIE